MNGTTSVSGTPTPNNGRVTDTEAGGTDNRMYWDPSQFEPMAELEDGKEYNVTLRLRQTSAGEGQIISVAKVAPADEEAETPSEDAPEMGAEEGGGDGGYDNPAVAKLMAGPKQ